MTVLDVCNGVVLLYFLLLNAVQLVTAFFAMGALRRYSRRLRVLDILEDFVTQGGAPTITLLVPAFNEEATCVGSVRSLLTLEYSNYEILVINDGSTDDTLGELTRAFDLSPAARFPWATLPTSRVRATFRSARYPNLWVIDKENGGKADALNAGLNHCRTALFCAMDADSVLERDALTRIVRPFIEDERTVAAGGIVRIANGCVFRAGTVTEVRMPGNLLARFQVLEYLRAFLTGRMGWDALNSLLIISGAFGLFRRQVVVEAGGFARDTVGEDMELIIRLHRYCREKRMPYRITFVPDPVAWTECPEKLGALARQRDRWQRGLAQGLTRHMRMLFNPRYGVVGLLAFPYFFFLEMLGPLVELFGYVTFLVAVATHQVSVAYVAAFSLLAFAFGMTLSVAAVALEEISFHRYRRPGDYFRLFFLALVENFGYRQLSLVWRLKGLVTALFGVKSWGHMPRVGFSRGVKGALMALCLLGVAGRAGASSDYWELYGGTEQQNYGTDKTGWYSFTEGVKRRYPSGDSLVVERQRLRRFSKTDNAGILDAYATLWPRAYGNVRFQAVPVADVMPRSDVFAEVYQGFGTRWEASFRARHMDYPADNVDLYSLSLAKYFSRWYALSRVTWVPAPEGTGVSREFVIRRYGVSPDDFFQITLGRTSDSAVGAFTPGSTGNQSTYAHTRAQKVWRGWVGLSFTAILEDEIRVPPRKGFALTWFLRYNKGA